MISTCSNLVQGMTLGYPTSCMILGVKRSKVKVTERSKIKVTESQRAESDRVASVSYVLYRVPSLYNYFILYIKQVYCILTSLTERWFEVVDLQI